MHAWVVPAPFEQARWGPVVSRAGRNMFEMEHILDPVVVLAQAIISRAIGAKAFGSGLRRDSLLTCHPLRPPRHLPF